MFALGIDTSCDDTSAALVEITPERVSIISNIVSSQTDIHTKYGGIVPELASRRHIEMIWPVVQDALGETKLSELSIMSVCHGPGLIGSLLVGCSFAKSLSYASGIPLVGVNHLEGHILSAFLEGTPPEFPFLSLVVSGGHTSIYRTDAYCQHKELGRTRDDAAGEAYDKISKLIGLGYPGGPIIDRLSKTGNPKAFSFPRAYLPGSLDFSFSGLKTAVRLMHDSTPSDQLNPSDVSASFQSAVIDVLIRKLELAMASTGISSISVSGGVAANSELRARLTQMADRLGVKLSLPSLALCTDNAAMIALAGYHRYNTGERASMDMNPKAYLPLL